MITMSRNQELERYVMWITLGLAMALLLIVLVQQVDLYKLGEAVDVLWNATFDPMKVCP